MPAASVARVEQEAGFVLTPHHMGRAFEYRRASKEARWDKMSKLFPKLGRTITMAAKAGGPDPDSNPALRSAIATAKAENMPKDNVKKAIERAEGKDAADFQEINYEGKGPARHSHLGGMRHRQQHPHLFQCAH